jgi:hypothetical protein
VASNDASGVSALHQNSPGSWVVSDKGICPVGGSLCNKGGPKLTSNIQLADYAPTPGGPRNCVLPFFTSPASRYLSPTSIRRQLVAAWSGSAPGGGDPQAGGRTDGLKHRDRRPRLAELHAAYDHRERMLEVDRLSQPSRRLPVD